MISKQDKLDIEKSKKLKEEQIEETKKLDLGLDADGSSQPAQQSESMFAGFTDPKEPPTLEGK